MPLSPANSRSVPRELSYVQFTGNVASTQTVEASAQVVVTAAALTFDGATVVVIAFGCALWTCSGTTQVCLVDLFEDGSPIGQMWGAAAPNGSNQPGIYTQRRMTPTAGAHTYSIRTHLNAAGTFTVGAGVGGAAAVMPGFVRIASSV